MAIASVDYFRTLFDYTYWGRDKILATAAQLSEADFTRPCGLDYPSIRATIAHQLESEVLIFNRWQGKTGSLTEDDLPSLERIREVWREHEGNLRAFVDGLTDTDLERRFTYRNRAGVQMTEHLWQSMYQIVNHGTQHRSEIALALTQMGHSPGFLDFVVFVRERESG